MKKLLVGLVALALLATPAVAQVNAPIPKPIAGLTNTAQSLKASAGVLQWAVCDNTDNAFTYVQVFDVAGAVTVGTTPATAVLPLGKAGVTVLPLALQTFNAIKVAATTGPANGTAPTTPVNCTFGIN